MIELELLTIELGRYPRDTHTRPGQRLARGLIWIPYTVLLLLILAYVFSLAPESIPARLMSLG